MRVYFCLFYLFLNLEIQPVLMDFYSSILTLTKLSQEEVRLSRGLKRYINAETKDGNVIDEYLTKYLQTTEDEINSQGVPENPIDAFHLLRRWVQDWEKCFERVFCDDCVEDGPAIDFNLTRGIIQKHLNGWPSQEDIDAAITALFRLWDTYEFKLEDLFHGKLYNFKTKPFTPEDILYIANKAEDRKDMYTSVRFLETLLDEFKKGNFPDSSLSVIRIAKATASAYNRNDMPWKSVEILKEYIELEPENKRLRADYDYFKTKADSIPESERISILEKADKDLLKVTPTIDYDVDIIKKYRALCRGHVKTNEELSRLYCYYKETEIPIYRVKVEMANLQPKVFLFHDVISEYEMNFMKNASTPKLERSVVLHETNAQGPAESRISRTAWLLDTDYPLLQKISKRVKLITGLETEYKSRFSNAEQYQVLNYGIGGMYRPHIDPLNTRAYDKNQAINPVDTKYSGDRIATFMFYLSDVMYGGATVFPKLNARVPVQKGCAAFWYNLDLNGDVNTNMTHAGCPVLVGSKWVSNKWIREIGQAFRRRCGLKRNSKDRRR